MTEKEFASNSNRTEIYHKPSYYKKSIITVILVGVLLLGSLLAIIGFFSNIEQTVTGKRPFDFKELHLLELSPLFLLLLVSIPILVGVFYLAVKDYFSNAPGVRNPAIVLDGKGISTDQIDAEPIPYDAIEYLAPVTFDVQPNNGKTTWLGIEFKDKMFWKKLAEKNGVDAESFKWGMGSVGVYGEDYYISIENLEFPVEKVVELMSKNPEIAKRMKPMEVRQTQRQGLGAIDSTP